MKKIVVAAAIRNAVPYIDSIFSNINVLCELFDKVHCVFVESDSTDNTNEYIKSKKKQLKCGVTLYTFGNTLNRIPNRMQRISKARNFYLDVIEKEFTDYDYLYVLDFNETNIEPYEKELILSNFNSNIEWNMICANQEPVYYDLYALRHKDWMPFNCWNAIGKRPAFMSYEQAHNIFVKSRFIKLDRNKDLINVESAFGGSAFIKIDKIDGARHAALDENGEEECEWVSFCKGIGNVYINPKFINMTKPNRHYLIAMNQ